jgi:hypothetical protein
LSRGLVHPWASIVWIFEAESSAAQIARFLVAPQALGMSLKIGTYDLALSEWWSRLSPRPSISAVSGRIPHVVDLHVHVHPSDVRLGGRPLPESQGAVTRPQGPRHLLARTYAAAAIATPIGETLDADGHQRAAQQLPLARNAAIA